MSTENGKPPGIYRKIAGVLAQIEEIPKTGKNPHFGYAFHEEQVIVEHLRPLLAERGVVIVVSQGERTVEEYEDGKKIVVAPTAVTFVDSEDGSSFTASVWGEGQDTQDKGSHKALVGAFKYALMKTFLISSGKDDPEHDRGAKPSRGRRQSPDTEDAEFHCPECGGPMWDNRADKEAGKVKPKYPDFKCRDKACDNAIWGPHPDEPQEASEDLISRVKGLLDVAGMQDLVTLDQAERVHEALESAEKDRIERARTWLKDIIKNEGEEPEEEPEEQEAVEV